MPGWIESLSAEDLDRVLANVDYYAALGVPASAHHAEIKSSWRELVKVHHPDRAGAGGHATMIVINAAWEVLGDERLRHAYDHREELLGFLQEAEAASADFDEGSGAADFEMVIGCVECRLGFGSFDDAADHVDEFHPATDYRDILVSLADDEEEETEETRAAVPRWRCRKCAATFSEYSDALEHADRAHPDRLSVDPRTGVEAA
jgi:DnaJ-class molecular chaperone